MPADAHLEPPVPEGRWASFRYRDFSILQVSRLINMISFQMMGVALAYNVYEHTQDPMTLGYLGLAQFLPAIIFALVSGHVADRFNRRIIIQICLFVLVICMLLLIYLTRHGFHDMFYIYCILFLIGTARAFLHPATQALMPQLVPRRLFSNAITWSSSIFNLSAIAGPGIGGALYALHNGALPVYIDSCVMMSIATLLMFFIKAPMQTLDETGSTWERLVAGIKFVFHRRVILGAISLDLFAVLLGGATALLPIYAKDILHVGPQGLGFLRAAFSVGSICMGLVLTHLPPMRKAGNTMFWNVAGFGLFTVIFGISTNYWLSLVCLFMLGVFDMVSVVIRHTMVQLLTPDEMRGRVSAVNAIFINTSNELGEFESGFTAKWWGTVTAVVIGGLGTLAVTALWAWWFPELRRFKQLDQSHEDLLREQEIEVEQEAKVAV